MTTAGVIGLQVSYYSDDNVVLQPIQLAHANSLALRGGAPDTPGRLAGALLILVSMYRTPFGIWSISLSWSPGVPGTNHTSVCRRRRSRASLIGRRAHNSVIGRSLVAQALSHSDRSSVSALSAGFTWALPSGCSRAHFSRHERQTTKMSQRGALLQSSHGSLDVAFSLSWVILISSGIAAPRSACVVPG